jgi:hypothetical protein
LKNNHLKNLCKKGAKLMVPNYYLIEKYAKVHQWEIRREFAKPEDYVAPRRDMQGMMSRLGGNILAAVRWMRHIGQAKPVAQQATGQL